LTENATLPNRHPERSEGSNVVANPSRSRQYYVYIMTNRRHSPLYVGVTNDLVRRVYEHRNRLAKGFASKYNITMLMYYETTESVESAIAREKQLKGWLKRRKIALIESANPNWRDLSLGWFR